MADLPFTATQIRSGPVFALAADGTQCAHCHRPLVMRLRGRPHRFYSDRCRAAAALRRRLDAPEDTYRWDLDTYR